MSLFRLLRLNGAWTTLRGQPAVELSPPDRPVAQFGRRYFRPETLALIDAEPEIEEVAPALLMGS